MQRLLYLLLLVMSADVALILMINKAITAT